MGNDPTQYATGIADLSAGRIARLLGGTNRRSGAVLSKRLEARGETRQAQMRTVSLDPFRGYATGLITHLPAAVRVLDPFPRVKLTLAANRSEIFRALPSGPFCASTARR